MVLMLRAVTCRHGPVMALMMITIGHQTNIAQTTYLVRFFGVQSRGDQSILALTTDNLHAPSAFACQHARVDLQYPRHGDCRPLGLGLDNNLQAQGNWPLREHIDIECNIIHIDQVLPEYLKVHLRPVGIWISIEPADHLLNRTVGIITGLVEHTQGKPNGLIAVGMPVIIISIDTGAT